jgi:hypothetical protein
MNSRITKSMFLNALACPTLAWFRRNLPPAHLSAGEELRILEGKQLGERARRQFPGGVLIDDADLVAAAEKTEALMADQSIAVIFEATFLAEPYVT